MEILNNGQKDAVYSCLSDAYALMGSVDDFLVEAMSWTYFGSDLRDELMNAAVQLFQVGKIISGIAEKVTGKALG